MRLDKYLSSMRIGTRSEVKGYIKKGRITLNGVKVKSPDVKIRVEEDIVCFDNKQIEYKEYEYFMLNKPMNVVSATRDNHSATVSDLVKSNIKADLFPIGRLDKDTEGLIILTNDGELTHKLLSPKNHIPKVYYAKVEGIVEDIHIERFKQGLHIEDYKTLPAELLIITSGNISEVELTIYEGKFHQVKRMFQAVNMKVIYLKRISMGGLVLDDNLSVGEYRELTEEEINRISDNKRRKLC